MASYTREYLESLSDDELRALYEQEKQPSLARAIENPPTSDDPESYWGTALWNIPQDIPRQGARVASELAGVGKAMTSPEGFMGLTRGLGRFAAGAVGVGDPLDPNSPSGQVMNYVDDQASYLPGGEKFRDEPLRLAADWAGMIPAGPQGAGTMARLGRAASAGRFLDPVMAAGKTAQLGGRALARTGKAATNIGGHMIGLATGQGTEPAMAGVRAGREGVGGAFREAARGELMAGIGTEAIPGLGREVAGQVNLRRRAAGAVKGKFIDQMDQAGTTVNIADLKARLLGDIANGGEGGLLSELGLTVNPAAQKQTYSPILGPKGQQLPNPLQPAGFGGLDVPESFRAADQGAFEEAIRLLVEAPDDIPVRQLDEIKQGIDAIPIGSRPAKSQRIIHQIRSAVREELGKVAGYDDAVAEIAQHFDTMGNPQTGIARQLRRADLGQTKKPIDPQALGESLTRSLNEGIAQADRMEAVRRLEELMPGSNLGVRAAGLRFTGEMPTGLVGKNEFVKLAGVVGLSSMVGGGMAGMTGALGGALLSVPVIYLAFIPKYASGTLVKLGAAQRGGAQLQQFAETAVKQAVQLGINPRNLSLGRLLERLDQEQAALDAQRQQPNSIRGLGRFSAMPEPER